MSKKNAGAKKSSIKTGVGTTDPINSLKRIYGTEPTANEGGTAIDSLRSILRSIGYEGEIAESPVSSEPSLIIHNYPEARRKTVTENDREAAKVFRDGAVPGKRSVFDTSDEYIAERTKASRSAFDAQKPERDKLRKLKKKRNRATEQARSLMSEVDKFDTDSDLDNGVYIEYARIFDESPDKLKGEQRKIGERVSKKIKDKNKLLDKRAAYLAEAEGYDRKIADIETKLGRRDKNGVREDAAAAAKENKQTADAISRALTAPAGYTDQEVYSALHGDLYSPRIEDLANRLKKEDKLKGQAELAKGKSRAYEYYNKHKDDTYSDTKTGLVKGNYRLGDISERESSAGYTSYKQGTDDIEAANVYQKLSERIQQRSQKALKTNGFLNEQIANVAQYVPQFLNQTAARVPGAAAGALLGLASSGPAGAVTGVRLGGSAAVADYMFKQTAGNAYLRHLRDSELSTADAKKLATSEAIPSGAIEFGLDYVLSGLFAGTGKATSAAMAKFGKKSSAIEGRLVKAMVKKGLSQRAAETAIGAAKTAGKVAVHSLGEGAEEWLQGALEKTADRAAKKGESLNPLQLVAKSFDLSEYTKEDLADMNKSFIAGAVIGLAGTSAQFVQYGTVNKVLGAVDDRSLGRQIRKAGEVENVIREGLQSTNARTKRLAATLQNSNADTPIAVAQQDRRMGQLQRRLVDEKYKALGDEKGDSDAAVDALVREGLDSDVNSPAYGYAKEIQAKRDKGQYVTQSEVDTLIRLNDQAIAAEASASNTENAQTPGAVQNSTETGADLSSEAALVKYAPAEASQDLQRFENNVIYAGINDAIRRDTVQAAAAIESAGADVGRIGKEAMDTARNVVGSMTDIFGREAEMDDIGSILSNSMAFVAAKDAEITPEYIARYAETYISVANANGADINFTAEQLTDDIITGSHTTDDNAVADVKNIIARAVGNDLRLHGEIHGTSDALNAQAAAVARGDYSFMRQRAVDVGSTIRESGTEADESGEIADDTTASAISADRTGASVETAETGESPDVPNAETRAGDRYDVIETQHTKTGKRLWVVRIKDRLTKDEYNTLRAKVKEVGGYYSKYVKTLDGQPAPGFVFESEPDAKVIGVFNEFFGGVSETKTKATTTESEAVPKKKKTKIKRAKKSEWSAHDTYWYAPKSKTVIAYSTRATSDYIEMLADDNPNATIAEIKDLVTYDPDAEKVLQAYIDSGFGDEIARDHFSRDAYYERRDAAKIAAEKSNSVLNTADESGTIKEKQPSSSGEPKVAEETGAEGEPTERTPVQSVANFVRSKLERGEKITANDLFLKAKQAFGGSMAEGAFTVKDAYDAMELGVNKYILSLDGVSTEKMLDILDKLPTQTKRTEAMEKYQQFSTPPSIAYLASYAANINSDDVMLEPSAGIGGIAVFAKREGAKVYVNELDKRRLDILKNLPFDGFYNEDAEQINNILGRKIKPTVVVMNPPFSSSSERNVKNNKIGAKHIEQALKTLAPGGRLVAITGRGMADGAPAFRSWWKDIKSKYNVVANIGVDGKNYNKYGTTFDIQMLVIDNTGSTGSTITENVSTLDELENILGGIRDGRPDIEHRAVSAEAERTDTGRKRDSGAAARAEAAPGIREENGRPQTVSDTGSRADVAQRSAEEPAADGNRLSGAGGRAESNVSGRTADVASESADADRGGDRSPDDGREVSRQQRPEADRRVRGESGEGQSGNGKGDTENVNTRGTAGADNAESDRSGAETGDNGQRGRGVSEQPDDIRIKPKKSKKKKVLTDSVYDDYEVQPLKVKNAQPHPTKVSESSAMASVSKPAITYKPHIQQELIDNGVLSDVQLEPISYAGQNHQHFLENGRRKGFFIGDGTGLGKGRIVAGIILDNRNQGRNKAVWISERPNLFSDAQRDIGAVVGDASLVHQFEGGKKADRSLGFEDGVLFAAYPSLSKGWDKPGSNFEKLTAWLGEDYDGVIAFDESHNMANSGGSKKGFGRTKPSGAFLMGKALSERFPKARIVYLSATGATEVENLQYADRLGLWGADTAFRDATDFTEKIKAGGVAAMELVASNMKENGVYLSRNISYDGVKYDRITHKMEKHQRETYSELARAWQLVLENMNKALELTNQRQDGMARGRQNSAFWSGQQRFFNQVLTAMQTPSVIKDIEKQLEQGRSAVIQLVSTNEAAQKRESERLQAEELDLESFDLTPKQILMSYIENVFPVQQYEEYVDEDGNKRVRPVYDSAGNPVENAEAVAQREELLNKLGALKVPSSPIDMIIEHFGADAVAEVTGRSKRVYRKDGKMVEETRNKSTNAVDVDAFQNGDKRILIFSGAGATGKSYHADRNAKNQQQRVHYLLEAGWVANKAVQGFGRSHRSNQATTPIFKLVTTDLKGQNRFISTIAKRLSQLGALTKGSAKAGNQGMFTADDDLEGPIASDVLSNYYKELMLGKVRTVDNGMDVIEKLGLKSYLVDEYGAFKEHDAWRDVTKFLNRILVLEPDEQNAVFDGFSSRLMAANEIARQNGTLDRGLENYRADGLTVKESKVVRTDEASGAKTTYYNLEARHKVTPVTFENVKASDPTFEGFYKNKNNDSVRAMFRSNTKTDERGRIIQNYRGQTPTGYGYLNEDQIIRSWEKIKAEEARGLWDKAVGEAPAYKTNPVHLLTGNLLSIWGKMPSENVRVYRMATDDGDVLLGRVIDDKQIDDVLHQLGSSRTRETIPTSDVIKQIQQDGATVTLENGWTIKQSRVSGENRLELVGPAYADFRYLEPAGVFTERISFNTRCFIPTGAKAEAVMNKVFKLSPLKTIESKDEVFSLEDYNEEGETLSDGGGERQDGNGAGVTARRVDQGARGYQKGRETAAQRREQAKAFRDAGNTEQKEYGQGLRKVRGEFVKREAYNPRMQAIAAENKAKGVNTEFVVGNLDIAFHPRSKARGVYDRDTNTVIIRYDHPYYSPEQLNLHERYHAEYGSERAQKVLKVIRNSLSLVDRQKALEKLARDYSGIERPDLMMEEFVANTLAGMNEYAETYRELISDYWSGAEIDVDKYSPAEYTESIDAGGNAAVIDNLGCGESETVLFDPRYSLNGSQPGVMWTIGAGVMDNRDVAQFYTKIGESNRNYPNYHTAADGSLIFEIGHDKYVGENKLVYTDGDFEYPKVSRVITFNSQDGFEVETAKEAIYDAEAAGYSPEVYTETIGAVYGEGFITVTDRGDYEADYRPERAGEDRSSSEGETGRADGLSFSVDTIDRNESEFTPEIRAEMLKDYRDDNMAISRRTVQDALKGSGSYIKEMTSRAARVFPEIPERGAEGTFYAEFRKSMVQWKALPQTASFRVQNNLRQMTEGLSKSEFDTFSKLVYYLDLQEEAQMQQERGIDEVRLPHEYTAAQVDGMVNSLMSEASDNVKKALKTREEMWSDLVNSYVAHNQYIGFDVAGRFNRKHYYRHQVIDYMNRQYNGVGGNRTEVNDRRGWLKQRQGSTAAINTDFLEVEYSAMLQMTHDMYVANLLGKVKDRYNIKPRLEAQARSLNKAGINAIIAREANGRFDENGRPDSEAYRQQQWYNRRIMTGFSDLMGAAKAGHLPSFNGRYSGVIRALAGERLDHPDLYKYVSEIVAAPDVDDDIKIAAGTVLKFTSQKRQWVKALLGKDYETWETLAEKTDGYSIHQPRRGNYFYNKTVIDEEAFAKAFSEMTARIAAGDPGLFSADGLEGLIKEYGETVRLTGAPYEQWVIPDKIIKTLAEVGNPKPDGTGSLIAREMLNVWKGWSTSLNPLRTFKFGLRNLVGDVDAVIAGKPQLLTYTPRAVKEIYQAMVKKQYTKDFLEWTERGGYSSMMFINEMDRAAQEKLFKKLVDKTGKGVYEALKLPKKAADKYVDAVQGIHDFREAILRYSAYLYFKDDIAKHGRVRDNVASNRWIIAGLDSTEDKAYQLSKDLLGAYDEVSKLGQNLRRYWIPFYSFTETNFKRYSRMIENIIRSNGNIGKKAGKLLLKALQINLLGLLMLAWNKLVKKDDDDKLPPSVRNIPHITLGRIGDSVYAFRQLGSFSELLEWFGLDDYKWEAEDLMAPVDKLTGMITPAISNTASVLTGLNFYPSVRNPSVIRDRASYLANSFGVSGVFDIISGKPNKGWGEVAKGAVTYSYDIEESAYNEIISHKYNYQGRDDGTIYGATPKSNALYYMKKAVKYKDEKAALKYLDKYFEAGGTGKGLASSFDRLNPMYGFTGKDTQEKGKAWIASMSEDEKEKLRIAQAYYEQDLALPESLRQQLHKKNDAPTDEQVKKLMQNYIRSQCR